MPDLSEGEEKEIAKKLRRSVKLYLPTSGGFAVDPLITDELRLHTENICLQSSQFASKDSSQ